MTVVEETPETVAAPQSAEAAEELVRPSGLAGLLGTVDHIGVGRMFVVASLLFLLIAGIAGALVGVERIDATEVTVLDDALVDLFSLHATAGIFLFLLPAFLGVAIAVVPLQVGAATIAFPRAAAASFWGWFLSGCVLVASYAIEGGLDGESGDGGRLLFAIGLGGVAVSLCLATLCVVTTVWGLRTAGMRLDRVPLFAWSMFVAGVIWLASLPVLVAGLVLWYLQFQYGAPLDAESLLDWAFAAPQVFAYAIPALGLLLEVVPVAARVRRRYHGVLMGAIGAFAVLCFGADLVMLGRDPSIAEDALYVGVAFALLLPLLAIAGGVADTLRRGRLNLTSPLLFGIVALIGLFGAAVTNAIRVIEPLDLVGTTADTAVAHLALAAGAVAVAGALHHWSSKLFGTVLGEGVGRTAALLLLVGGAALTIPDLISGFLDQLTGLSNTEVEDGVEALNLVSLIGGGVVLLGVVLVLVNLVAGATGRSDDEPTPDDPWDGGQTLEWRTASPPRPGGPGPLEPVASPEPVLDLQEASA